MFRLFPLEDTVQFHSALRQMNVLYKGGHGQLFAITADAAKVANDFRQALIRAGAPSNLPNRWTYEVNFHAPSNDVKVTERVGGELLVQTGIGV